MKKRNIGNLAFLSFLAILVSCPSKSPITNPSDDVSSKELNEAITVMKNADPASETEINAASEALIIAVNKATSNAAENTSTSASEASDAAAKIANLSNVDKATNVAVHLNKAANDLNTATKAANDLHPAQACDKNAYNVAYNAYTAAEAASTYAFAAASAASAASAYGHTDLMNAYFALTRFANTLKATAAALKAHSNSAVCKPK